VTPHVAQKSRHAAIDGRVARHKGYALSIEQRKWIEEAFGWVKTVGGMAQTVYRGIERVRFHFILTMAPTTSPGCRDCWPRDDAKPRGRHTPSAAKSESSGSTIGNRGKPFRPGNYFSSLPSGLRFAKPYRPCGDRHRRKMFYAQREIADTVARRSFGCEAGRRFTDGPWADLSVPEP